MQAQFETNDCILTKIRLPNVVDTPLQRYAIDRSWMNESQLHSNELENEHFQYLERMRKTRHKLSDFFFLNSLLRSKLVPLIPIKIKSFRKFTHFTIFSGKALQRLEL